MTLPRISPTCDLERLEALARAAQEEQDFDAFIAALSPAVLLALIEQARAGARDSARLDSGRISIAGTLYLRADLRKAIDNAVETPVGATP